MLALILAALVLMILVSFMPGLYLNYEDWGDQAFDSQEWKSIDGNVPGNPRGSMIADLLENHELVGLTRSEVESLLGRPDSPRVAQRAGDLDRDSHLQNASEWQYYVGVAADFTHVLALTFGPDDRVTRWRIWAG